MYVVISLNFRG